MKTSRDQNGGGSRRAARGGFAFTEVLFAVMVLGIGFIMIAAMFPITIRQTQSTMGDTHGANVAKGALTYLQSIASDLNFPVTTPAGSGAAAPVYTLSTAPGIAGGPKVGYLEASGNFIDPNNPRFAWVPLYRRGFGADGLADPYAQVIIIVLQSRNRPQYTSTPQNSSTAGKSWTDLLPWDGIPVGWGTPPPTIPVSSFPAATLEPSRNEVTLKYAGGRGVMTFPKLAGQLSARPAVGAFVVIADDNSPTPGQSNGRIYQLGNPIDEANQIWELAPGADMIRKGASLQPGEDNDLPVSATPSTAFIVGRGYTDMTRDFDITKADQGYSGAAQDIAIYTGFIQISR